VSSWFDNVAGCMPGLGVRLCAPGLKKRLTAWFVGLAEWSWFAINGSFLVGELVCVLLPLGMRLGVWFGS